MNDSKKTTPPEEDKVAKVTSTTNSQSGNTQPDNNISLPDDEMERYATNDDVLEAKDEIIDKMDACFERLNKTMDAGFTGVRNTMHEQHKDLMRQFARTRNLILVGIIIILLDSTGLFEYFRNLLPFLP